MASFSMTGLLDCERIGCGPRTGAAVRLPPVSYTTLNGLSATRRNLGTRPTTRPHGSRCAGSRPVSYEARRARYRVAVVTPGAPGVAPRPVREAAGGYWMFWWVRKT